ncbi:hypothetical protein [Stutzerimonas zhaodongensis]|uniref:hypothetical protein n=1 Tax=Stutzerimonas TaxID=2901164 RepID=UPI00388F9EBD
MGTTTVDMPEAEQWGVVYSYGSVLALFENELDAQNEASSFGGAVVRVARNLWSALCDTGASAETC